MTTADAEISAIQSAVKAGDPEQALKIAQTLGHRLARFSAIDDALTMGDFPRAASELEKYAIEVRGRDPHAADDTTEAGLFVIAAKARQQRDDGDDNIVLTYREAEHLIGPGMFSRGLPVVATDT